MKKDSFVNFSDFERNCSGVILKTCGGVVRTDFFSRVASLGNKHVLKIYEFLNSFWVWEKTCVGLMKTCIVTECPRGSILRENVDLEKF